uniref:Sodium/solute symporter n=1 Tax=Photinus pyralis TaxID=7054 RepID=A0A1Y1KD11_PHOPY
MLDEEAVQFTFSWLDYIFFFGMLSLSALIGIYFGCCGPKQNSAKEYLLAGQTMNVLPVAMSLISSNISGITIMGAPADIYKYGANYIWSLISMVITSIACVYVYMPVFLDLQLVSTYQYLEMRFDRKIRTLASILFTLQVLLLNPILIYVPALAFSQATGLHLHVIAPTLCIVCIFYTTIGGLKAVLWTDTLQTTSIFVCLLVVFGMGLSTSGGVRNVVEVAAKGERLDIFDFRLDPTKRDSFWAFVLGCTVSWMVDISINQSTMQRVMAVPTKKQAERVIYIFCVGTMLIKAFTTFIGVMMYAKYSECDPIGSGKVTHTDQMVPYYVIDVGGKIPGLPGLFIAGIFSGALSSLSTTLNTLAATFYSDFVSLCVPDTITEKTKSKILKLIVVVGGIICILLVFVVEKMGGILQLTVTFSGITSGSLLGLFTLGMIFPFANSKGALCGGVAGLVFNSWLVLSNQWYKYQGLIKDYPKPLSVEGCTGEINTNVTQGAHGVLEEEPNAFYRISFWYYTFLGFLVVIVVGLVVSWLTRKNNPPVRPELLSPSVQFLLPKEKDSEIRLDTTKL